jgi:motility quorum-sensing regulator / GCU-specific mRNA interferase toxin
VEKRTPHCRLSVVLRFVDERKVRTTNSAVAGALSMGLVGEDLIDVVRNLTMADFLKSMTSYRDHRLWQDVYRPMTKNGRAYVKLMVVDDVLIVSFKEL